MDTLSPSHAHKDVQPHTRPHTRHLFYDVGTPMQPPGKRARTHRHTDTDTTQTRARTHTHTQTLKHTHTQTTNDMPA